MKDHRYKVRKGRVVLWSLILLTVGFWGWRTIPADAASDMSGESIPYTVVYAGNPEDSNAKNGPKTSMDADPVERDQSTTSSNTHPDTQDQTLETPWCLTLVNSSHLLPEGYEPHLVKLEEWYRFDERAAESLTQMLNDARRAGLSPKVCSAYRSEKKQKILYDNQVVKQKQKGYSEEEAREKAKTVVAYPGTSEHQLGLAADIVATDYQILDGKQANTPEAEWLMENCWKYGFILRYPQGKSDITGVIFEPWHYRYVGIAAATEIMKNGICLEEYLDE